MKVYECDVCGFFYTVGMSDDLTDKEKAELDKCPCGATMREIKFSINCRPTPPGMPGEESS